MSLHIIKHTLHVEGDITLSGLVDGRDISIDGSTLDTHVSATSGAHGVSGDLVGTSDSQTLSNKSLIDESTLFVDDSDNTKKSKFQLSSISTGTTRTLTIPDADITLVGVANSQTLTNKSINADNNTITNIANANIKSGAGIDAGKLHDGSVSNTEFAYLSGLTSPILGTTMSQTVTNKLWGDNLNMNNNKIINLATPIDDFDAANKIYVDSVAQGLDFKHSVIAKTTAPLPAYTQGGTGVNATLTGSSNGALPQIDGVTLSLGDRVLIDSFGTTLDKHNGIYVVTDFGSAGTPWVLTRAEDADEDSEVTPGLFVFVEEGTLNAQCGYVLSTSAPIVVDTTPLEFVQFSGAGQITVENVGSGGVGIFKEKDGNTIRLKNINAASNKVSVTNDTGNNEVDIDVVESNISIGNLSGAPSGSVVGSSDVQTLTNKSLVGSTTYIIDNVDNSKKMQFQLSSVSTSTTRTITVPDADITLVGTSAPQTLTNKTINADNNTLSNIADSNIKSGAGINAGKLHDGSVSNTEFGYLAGATSNIQTQIGDHTSATSGVHGVSGNVVGTTDSQTLSNKTLTAPNVQNNLIITSGYIEVNDVSAPNNPGNGKGRIYKKTSDSGLYWKADASGPEISLSDTDTIQGISVSETTPSDGQHLIFNALENKWAPSRSPKQTTLLYDDFITSSLSTMWVIAFSGSGSTVDVVDGIGGQVNVTSGSTINNYAELRISNKTLIKSSDFKVIGRLKLASNLNTLTEFGLYNDANNLIRFFYNVTTTPGNWYAETINAGNSTTNDTSSAANTAWHIFEIHGSNSEIKFYIDDTLCATNSSNLPTGLLRIYIKQTSVASSSKTITCDYIEATCDRE
jgi:hypothetical protein